MKKILTAILCLLTGFFFSSCQQEQNDDLTITLRKEELTKTFTYWYQVTGTITFTSTEDSSDTYETSISNGNLYVSWTEDPNNKSNYKNYNINLQFDYISNDSTSKNASISKAIRGIGNKYDFMNSKFSTSDNITDNNFTCTIDYPNFSYIHDNYKTIWYNAKIKLTCKKA